MFSMDLEGITVESKTQRIFEFSFPMKSNRDEHYKLKVLVDIPYKSCPLELCARIVSKFMLPPYVEDDLKQAVLNFIANETNKYYDELTEEVITKDDDEPNKFSDILNTWEKVYVENTTQYGGDKFGTDDDELFSTVYHKLVHSPHLEPILQFENSYTRVIQELNRQRDEDLISLAKRQTEEMGQAIEEVNSGLTEAEVTALAGRHLEEHGMEIARWESELGATQEAQKRKYKDWLMALLEQSCDSAITTPVSSPLIMVNQGSDCNDVGDAQKLQESFTIHLGSQLKQMYNIRILSSDPLDFCRLRTSVSGEVEPQPQRLQTALGLYSNDLCGIVLLTDNCLGSFSGVTKDFVKVCESSTELHFQSIENQLTKVRESVKTGVEWRKHNPTPTDTNLLTMMEQQLRKNDTKYLQTGDVYLSKHSNLSEVHVVFHMVVDDSLQSNDINSRHPAILGLRNIIKCACLNDVTTLTIPVLLTHELTDEMVMNWCTKRAELIYKCVKGFMIEMASWGGSELKNLQFLVPKGISEEIFSALATMLPSIFRVSNPLVLKANNSLQASKNDKKDKKKKKKKLINDSY